MPLGREEGLVAVELFLSNGKRDEIAFEVGTPRGSVRRRIAPKGCEQAQPGQGHFRAADQRQQAVHGGRRLADYPRARAQTSRRYGALVRECLVVSFITSIELLHIVFCSCNHVVTLLNLNILIMLSRALNTNLYCLATTLCRSVFLYFTFIRIKVQVYIKRIFLTFELF